MYLLLRDSYNCYYKKLSFLLISGAASGATIKKLADETMKNDYLGIMVWYASVQNGLQYAESWDASMSDASKNAYIDAGNRFRAAE